MSERESTESSADGESPEIAVGDPYDEPFAVALREAIDARQVSLTWLHRRLTEEAHPVSIPTLSYWRSGQRRPEHTHTIEAIGVLEDLLHLDRGKLSDRLGPTRRSRPQQRGRIDKLMSHNDALPRGLRAVGLTPEPQLNDVSLHCTLEFGAQRRLVAITLRKVWRARVAGVTHAPVVVIERDPCKMSIHVEAIFGCTVGRTHRDAAGGIFVGELLLPRSLEQGETAVAEYRLTGFTGDEMGPHYLFYAQRRMHEIVFVARFQPGAVPAKVEGYVDSSKTAAGTPLTVAGNQAHYVVHNFGPGRAGLRWAWGADDPIPAVNPSPL